MKNRYQNSCVWRTGTNSSHMWHMVPNYHRCEEMVLNRHRCHWQKWRMWTECKMQQIWRYFINVRNTQACYMIFDLVHIFYKVWDIGTKYVTYWYKFFMCLEDSQGEINEAWNLRFKSAHIEIDSFILPQSTKYESCTVLPVHTPECICW